MQRKLAQAALVIASCILLTVAHGCGMWMVPYYNPVNPALTPWENLKTANAVTEKAMASTDIRDVYLAMEVLAKWFPKNESARGDAANQAADGYVQIVKKLEPGWPELQFKPDDYFESRESYRLHLLKGAYEQSARLAQNFSTARTVFSQIKPADPHSPIYKFWDEARVRFGQ